MIIDTWFPLAVAVSELAPTAATTHGMLDALQPCIAAAARDRRLGVAWTGDVNDCSDVHRRTPFAWLRTEVEREARAFADALGCNSSGIRFYFQASWPVLSLASERVASHTHPTASMSAVYYLRVPRGAGGTLVFENRISPNALVSGFGQTGSSSHHESNRLNLLEACDTPKEGQLLLFPARQPHAVRPHRADGLRASITFDIVLVAKDGSFRPDASWDVFAASSLPKSPQTAWPAGPRTPTS